MRSGLFNFHFNLRALVWWIVNGVLNNCKKGKIFLSKYAIYRKFQISSFGLTCFAKPRLASTYLCSFCSQVSEGEKNEGREKDVFKTYLIGTFIRRSDWDVFPCFQIESNMNVLLRTSLVRKFLVLVSTGQSFFRKVTVIRSKKMKAKYMKEDVWKSLFLINLQVGVSQLNYELISSKIIFRYFK